MPLTDQEIVETIEEGGGCVTEGDIHLLFEDVEREFAAMMSHNAKGHFLASKLLQRLQNLLEVYGSTYDEQQALPQVGGQIQKVGRGDDSLGEHARVDQPAVASRSPKASPKAKTPSAKKEKEEK